MITTNLLFDEWTEVFGPERLTGALLYRLDRHVHILEMNGESNASSAAARTPYPKLRRTRPTPNPLDTPVGSQPLMLSPPLPA